MEGRTISFNWSFASGDSQTAKVFNDLFMIDAVSDSLWDDLTYSVDSDDIHSSDDGKVLEGAIQKINDFKGGKKRGDTVTWYNGAALTGGPVLGDATIAGTTTPISTYVQSATIDQARKSTSDNGRLSAQRMPQDFRKTARRLLSQWCRVFMDETCNLSLVGETTFVNAYMAYTSGGFSTIMNNAVKTTDSGNIIYAGTATNNATASQPANMITAQLLTKLGVAARQSPTTANFIPVKKLKIKGSNADYAAVFDGEIAKQLRYDPEWRSAMEQGTPRSDSNRAIKGSLGAYDKVEIIEQARAFRPISNVSYGLLLGSDALNFLPVHEWEWVEDVVDSGFKNVIVVASMFGITPTYFNSTKRNMKMVPHYVAV